MQALLHDPVNAWLAAGALIIAFEAFTTPGIGLFLGGLGAISTALILKAGVIGETSTAAQFAWCFGFTVLWTAILWKPLQKFRMARKSRGPGELKSNNLIGETAVVAPGGLRPGEAGQVIWSGTRMSAELLSPSPLPEGAHVRIENVSGNRLKVVPK